jgi:hypothetical protein
MSDDPWADLAAEQISNPVKVRMRAAKTRAEHKAMKAQDDKTLQFQLWQKWHHQQVTTLMKGPFKKPVRILARFLADMTLQDGRALIELVERGGWHKADRDTRYQVLSLIDARIVYLREAEGWAPFSDAMPFSREEPTVFEIIRSKLNRED